MYFINKKETLQKSTGIHLSVGIDYSISSPAATFLFFKDGKQLSEMTKHFFLTTQKSVKEKASNYDFFNCQFVKSEFESKKETDKFTFLADLFVTEINKQLCFADTYTIIIEGFSYGSKGMLFNIAGNTNILFERLKKQNLKFQTESPSYIKKLSTGKGNADKMLMYEFYRSKTGINLEKIFDKKADKNPISDIADSYHIANLNHNGE